MRILSASLLILIFLVASRASADLRILHLDVGMGDSTLIIDTDTRRSLLIDAGNRGFGRTVVAPVLEALGISQLTYFLATHYDADHIGGFDEIVNAGISIQQAVLDRGDYTDRGPRTSAGNTTQYGEYLQAAASSTRRTVDPRCPPIAVPEIDLGTRTSIEIVAASGRYLRRGDSGCELAERTISRGRDNDLSVAVIVRHGDFSYFIGGDLTGGGNRTVPMEELVAAWVGDVDVLKLNHHGSATSSSESFLSTLAPEVAIISVGNGGVNLRYGLPRQEVLDRLAALRNRPLLFQTNLGEGGRYEGAFIESRHVAIYTDGTSYTVNGVVRPVDERLN